MFFDESDYEVFWDENVILNTKEIREKRTQIRDKLLEINSEIEKNLKKDFNLKSNKHIVSSLVPNAYNYEKVDWIGIKYYGKEKKIDKPIDNGKNGVESFKANCFELNIAKNKIEMGLYITFQNNPDNWYVQKQLKNKDEKFIKKLITEIEKIHGYGYEFNVSNYDTEEKEKKKETFKIDYYKKDDVGNKFIEFYSKECQNKQCSYILYTYPIKDERISDKEKIECELITHINNLYDLYKVLSATENL